MFNDLSIYIETAGHVLAPQPQIRKLLQGIAGDGRYVGIDLMDERFLDAKTDACNLPFADDAFDLMAQLHVLEHIPDGGAAIREMARVLKPGGIAFVQNGIPCGLWPLLHQPSDSSAESSAAISTVSPRSGS